MKRTIYLLAFLWAFLGQLNAQFDIGVDFGKIEKSSYIKKIIKLESGHILQLGLVGKKNYRVHFRLFDEQLNWRRSVESDVFYQPSKRPNDRKVFREIEVWGGKVYVFYMIYNSGKTFKLYAEELDQEMLQLSGKPILIGQFETKAAKYNTASDGIVKSHRENRMVFYVKETVKVENKLKTDHIQMVVLDESLNRLWQKAVFTPETGNRSNYLELTVNNAGEVFLLEQYLEGKFKFLESFSKKYAYTIHKFDARGTKRLAKDIDLEDRRTKRLSLRMTLNEELLVSGVFFTAEEGNGIAYMRFDTSTMEPQAVTFNLFDLEYIKEGLPKEELKYLMNQIDKGKGAFLPITIRAFIPRPDGELIILGEKFTYEKVKSMFSDGKEFRQYKFGSTYILCLDAMGEFKWKKKIAKNQEINRDSRSSIRSPLHGEYAYASFTWANQDDNIILFFNHLTRQEPSFDAVRIDEVGNMEREKIFNYKKKEMVIHPLRTRSLNKERTELILIGLYKQKQRLAYLRLE